MPQATNRRLMRDMNLSPIGKGTVYNSVHDISASTRERAMKANLMELNRLNKLNKIFDNDKRHKEYLYTRVMDRAGKSIKESEAFRSVLNNEYCVDNFVTMRYGFNRSMVHTPRTARRFKIETRIYHSGFEKKFLTPEINRKIRLMDPQRTKQIFQKVLLEKFKDKSDILMDRNMSHSAFCRMLQDQKNFGDYRYCRQPSKVKFTGEEENIISAVEEANNENNDKNFENSE